MRIIRSIKEMSGFSKRAHSKRLTLGFVPTMGALHKGHLSLIRRSLRDNDKTIVSIFVNPIQFGPKEDYGHYPRSLQSDVGLCKKLGVDAVFYPSVKDMYPDGYKTYVSIAGLEGVLCGRFRPGHFKGVTTVVMKLFNIVGADSAYFGQKDYQQAVVIKKMMRDLNVSVSINVMPIVREVSGLALSSRNAYLNNDEREDAAVLYQALELARGLIRKGSVNSLEITTRMRRLINKKKSAKIQYVSIVDTEELKPVKRIKGEVLIALAVEMGRTRLIDNILVKK
jgi:pantoate--beta-alanine ligase